MFIWINNGKYITTINKKLIRFSLFIDSVDTAPPPCIITLLALSCMGCGWSHYSPPQLTPLTPFYIFWVTRMTNHTDVPRGGPGVGGRCGMGVWGGPGVGGRWYREKERDIHYLYNIYIYIYICILRLSALGLTLVPVQNPYKVWYRLFPENGSISYLCTQG